MSEERKPNSGQTEVTRRSFLALTSAAGAAVTLQSNPLLNSIAPTFAEQFGITPEIAKYFSWLVQVDKAKDAIALFKDETADYAKKLEKASIMGERLEGDYNASEIYYRWSIDSKESISVDAPMRQVWNVTKQIRTQFFPDNRFFELRTESGISDIETRYQILFKETTSGLTQKEKEIVKIQIPCANLDDIPAFSNARHCRLVTNMYRCFSPANRAEAKEWVQAVSQIINKLRISDALKDYAAKVGQNIINTFQATTNEKTQQSEPDEMPANATPPISEELSQYVDAVTSPSNHNYVTWEDRLGKAASQKTIAQK